jgi:hypothetical protein
VISDFSIRHTSCPSNSLPDASVQKSQTSSPFDGLRQAYRLAAVSSIRIRKGAACYEIWLLPRVGASVPPPRHAIDVHALGGWPPTRLVSPSATTASIFERPLRWQSFSIVDFDSSSLRQMASTSVITRNVLVHTGWPFTHAPGQSAITFHTIFYAFRRRANWMLVDGGCVQLQSMFSPILSSNLIMQWVIYLRIQRRWFGSIV